MVYMCPDRQILSLYHDGELPSPWKEKLEAHLESCSECRNILAGYRNLGENPAEARDENMLAAKERVWKNLTAPELVMPERIAAWRPRKTVWNRTVTLPLPAAAAAAVVIIVALFALANLRQNRLPAADSMATAGIVDDQGMVPVNGKDMSGVLEYLSGQDNGDFMIISLPETRQFSRTGEPALINAADYSRRNASR